MNIARGAHSLPVALLVPLVTGVLFLDGEFSSIDGVLMLCAFLAWLVTTVLQLAGA